MDQNSIDPLDTGQRNRRKRRKRQAPDWVRRVLRNRRVLMGVLWTVKTVVQLARLIDQIMDGS